MAQQFIFATQGLGKVHPPDKVVLRDISLAFYLGAKIGHGDAQIWVAMKELGESHLSQAGSLVNREPRCAERILRAMGCLSNSDSFRCRDETVDLLQQGIPVLGAAELGVDQLLSLGLCFGEPARFKNLLYRLAHLPEPLGIVVVGPLRGAALVCSNPR